ncbi:DNA-protecting protein DprA [Nakamurella silvestris]|nr:DNA-protecting protein DprA [Nakamurella silvestris]
MAAFVGEVGPVAAFEAAIAGTAPGRVMGAVAARCVGRSPEMLRGLASVDLECAAAAGARLICPEVAEWPTGAFSGFGVADARGVVGSAAPLGLYVRGGDLEGLPRTGVTVVGARACTAYGQRVAADLAVGVVDAGLVVVSGGAFGVDAAAHRAALSAGGRTIAVLACGIDRCYPVANTVLLQGVAESGCVVSEYPPGTTPARHRFLVRNRLLAALGSVTVVVEAGRRSGSLSTAGAAALLGRVVMAVPGPVSSAMSVGCHVLLRDRFALVVTDAADVVQVVRGLEPVGLFPEPEVGADLSRPTDGLDEVHTRVYEALAARSGRSVEELSMESGIEGRRVMETLPVLQLSGLVRREGPLWFRVRTARSR